MSETKKKQMHEENYEGLNEQELEDVIGGRLTKPSTASIACPKCGKSLRYAYGNRESMNRVLDYHNSEEHKENSL